MRQTYKKHLVLPISNLLVLPAPVNASSYFPGGALILVFMATSSELEVKWHGLWWQRAGSEHSSYNLPTLFSTEEWHQSTLQVLHMQTILLASLRSSQREICLVPHPCMQPKQKDRLYFLYCHLPVHLMWGTLSVQNSMNKGNRFIIS